MDSQKPSLPDFFTASSPAADARRDRLKTGQHVVALVAEQHLEPDAGHHQKQDRPQPDPDLDALGAGEVVRR